MADKKIIDLPPLVSQASTDLGETSANGAGSFKETRAQKLAYTAANIAGAPYAVGDLIFANATNTLSKIPDIAVNNALISGGINSAPSYGKITYSHMQTEGASTLLGNPTGAPGAVSEITLGVGLAFDGTTLTATGDQSVTLQDAYDNGDGTITLSADKPFELDSTEAGFIMPSMSTAQYAAITNLNNGEMAWDTDLDRITVNVGTSGSPQIEDVAYLSDIVALEEDTIVGEMYFTANATPTTIAASNTPVKIEGTYVSGKLIGFTQSGGTLTYTLPNPRTVKVTVDLTATFNGSSNNVTIYVAQNNSVIAKSAQSSFFGGVTPANQANPVQCIVDLVQNDDIDVWIENNDSTDDPIVYDLNCIVNSIGGLSYGGVTIVGEDYLTIDGQEITAHPIDLSGTNATGILASSRFPALTGDVTTSSGSVATTIANQAVSYAKIQNISATSRLLGRYDTGAGSVQEIKLGTNLSLTGDTLNAAGDASVTLQDAFDNGNSIDQGASIPIIREVTSDGQVTLERIQYNVLSPTVPTAIDFKQYLAYDASNLGFNYFVEKSSYWDSSSEAATFSRVYQMYEGGAANIQKDYFAMDSKYRQNEFFRPLVIEPAATSSTVTQADPSSCFDVISTTVGTRPAPSMTEAQRDAISSPANGLLIYNTDTSIYDFFDGSDWVPGSAITGSYTPSFTGLANIGIFSNVRSSYIVPKFKSGEFATVTCSFTAVPTAISAVMYLSVPTFFNNFSSTGKASFVGGTSFATLTPTVMNTFRNADSVAASKNISVELNISASALNVSNTFYVTATFEIP